MISLTLVFCYEVFKRRSPATRAKCQATYITRVALRKREFLFCYLLHYRATPRMGLPFNLIVKKIIWNIAIDKITWVSTALC